MPFFTELKRESHTPPTVARRLLLFYLKESLAEEVMGDLEEKFIHTAKTRSTRRARLDYWFQVIHYIRPFAIRKTKFHNLLSLDMFKNYFTMGWRNMAKHKMYSAINIGGFALGIAACLLLALYIKGELSYDTFYSNKDRIYRVVRTSQSDGVDERGVDFPHPLAGVLKENFAEIENVGHYNDVPQFGTGSAEIRRTDRLDNTHEDGLVYMSQGLLEVLEVRFLEGNPSHALTEPHSIVITRKKAEKYFKGEDAVGKSLIINNEPKRTYTIAAVIEDFSSKSHLNFDFIMTVPREGFWEGESDSWCCSNYVDYVQVRADTDVPALEKKISTIIETHMIAAAMKNGDKEQINWLKSMQLELQPIDDIYLNVDGVRDDLNHGDIRFIWLFSSIAVFILFLACINFINLSTARSASRAKEVGIRKVVGSLRSALVRQFLVESFLFSFVAIVIGVAITLLLIPAFNNLVGRSLSFPWKEPLLIPLLLATSLVVGLIAGIYPSFYLSAFRPVKVLKGSVTNGSRRTTLRSALVIFQFTISTTLIIGTMIISRQMDFLLNTKLGFDKDRVLILEGTLTLFDKAVPLKKELEELADVDAVSISGYLPVESSTRNGGTHSEEGSETGLHTSSQQWSVDHDYVRTMGLKLIEGRDFSEKIASDSQAMIINESLARQLHLKDPIGKKIRNHYGVFSVIGVVEDFHFESLKQNITPVALLVRKNLKTIAVRVKSDDMTAAIQSITGVWKKFSPHQPIRISFLDDQYARTYDDVKRFSTVVTVFTTLAIIVASLGLFGLSAFLIQQRSREISIRIVLGASLTNIFKLLTQNFVVLVLISLVIATPGAWYLMNIWLEEYAYKIPITGDIFIITGVAAVGMVLLTVSYQSIKASLTNPVANLKSE
ncbi:MAG TPA: ABC transporter permease [Cyclobacteriaceae bacterium]|nr:ABC transporter permease [Cyclobacteriaceae bacterium]